MIPEQYQNAYDLLVVLEGLSDKCMTRFRILGSQKHGDAYASAPEGDLDLNMVISDLRCCIERAAQLDSYIKLMREVRENS